MANDERTTPADDALPPGLRDPWGVIEASSFPRSFKEYRLMVPFRVYAHSEEQALQRWKFFEDVLGHLFASSEVSHPLVRFVIPESVSRPGPDPAVELVEEHTVESARDLTPSMGSDLLPEWEMLDPDHDSDWDAEELAHVIFFGEEDDDDEDEESDED